MSLKNLENEPSTELYSHISDHLTGSESDDRVDSPIDDSSDASSTALESNGSDNDGAVRRPPSLPFPTYEAPKVPSTKEFLSALKQKSVSSPTVHILHANPGKVPFVWACYEQDFDQIKKIVDVESPLQIPSPPPYRFDVSPIPGAGQGMFATKALKPGETIVVERPIVVMPPVFGLEVLAEVVEKALPKLNAEDRDRLFSLANSNTPTDDLTSLTYGILNTNGKIFHIPALGELGHYTGIFHDIARCNHSCGPNAVWIVNGTKMQAELRTSRPIEANEEITVCYQAVCHSRELRQALLKTYGFSCTCKFCTLPPKAQLASDNARKFARSVHIQASHRWQEWINNPRVPISAFTSPLEGSLKLLKDENLHETRGDFFAWIASAHAAVKDSREFRVWARKTAGAVRLMEKSGYGFRNGEEWVGWLNHPETMPCWGAKVWKEEH